MLINVTDGRTGYLLGTLNFDVQPFWLYHRNFLLGTGAIFSILLILLAVYLRRSKDKVIPIKAEPAVSSYNHKFNNARFEGYFLNTKSGIEIPVLTWPANYINSKSDISLGEMLNMLDVTENRSEAHKIFFQAGNNDTVIFHHNTECIITIGRRNVAHGQKEVLKYDDKIYITFEDHATELEVRYKRVRKRSSQFS